MYKYYESIQLVKPHQKKCVDLTSLEGNVEEGKQEKNEMEAEGQ